MFKKLFNQQTRWAVGLVALIVLFAISLAFPGVRAFAGQFLGLFRVQKIEILPIDTTGLGALMGDETLTKQISQLMSDSVTVTKEPGDPQSVADAAAASDLAGFSVRLPSVANGAPDLTVQMGGAFYFVINREQAQALLAEAGHGDLELPASIDGAKIEVTIPTGVTAAYGQCPQPGADSSDEMPWEALRSCTLLAQMPSPTVNTPPDLDVQQLAEIGLQFTGMTAAEAHDFSQTVDWTTTLVVPLPRNGHDYSQVEVDGVTGNLIYRRSDDGVPARYTLVWVKNGIIYALDGFDDPQVGLDLANSLR